MQILQDLPLTQEFVTMEAGRRISVRRGNHLVPLLPHARDSGSSEQPSGDVLLETHLVSAGEIPDHEHPDLCIHLQQSGGSHFEWWSGGKNELEQTHPGSMILIPPGTRDRLRWSGSSERTILSIAPNGLSETASDLGIARPPEFNVKWSFDDAGLRRIVTEMAADAQRGWPLGGLYNDLITLGLKKHLLRVQAADPIRLPALAGGMSLPVLRRAMEYMNANLAEDVRLDDIAVESGMSGSHFAHEFRNSTGQTPYQYLLDQRMAKAKELLKATQLSVQFISATVGFRSPVNFIRAFRQRFGTTPMGWRKNS
jgi:AraC family transcriptional regulator